jgi:hypothetical protein
MEDREEEPMQKKEQDLFAKDVADLGLWPF